MWKDILWVGLGGGVGSVFRYLTSRLAARYAPADYLFVGTFAANLIGCFLIGLLSGWLLSRQADSQPFRLLLIVGFCGGYTTFSSFAIENLRLIQSEQWGLFFGYTLASVALGLLAVWAGIKTVGN
ncbi:MAG: fluoride efflux transporter CrcB [Dysgonamonadaceae bacterium]|jgi:CrcB protein|nr:fluoride efflux transporter CrcB [Dysgonamonadaceae bacterium]